MGFGWSLLLRSFPLLTLRLWPPLRLRLRGSGPATLCGFDAAHDEKVSVSQKGSGSHSLSLGLFVAPPPWFPLLGFLGPVLRLLRPLPQRPGLAAHEVQVVRAQALRLELQPLQQHLLQFHRCSTTTTLLDPVALQALEAAQAAFCGRPATEPH